MLSIWSVWPLTCRILTVHSWVQVDGYDKFKDWRIILRHQTTRGVNSFYTYIRYSLYCKWILICQPYQAVHWLKRGYLILFDTHTFWLVQVATQKCWTTVAVTWTTVCNTHNYLCSRCTLFFPPVPLVCFFFHMWNKIPKSQPSHLTGMLVMKMDR